MLWFSSVSSRKKLGGMMRLGGGDGLKVARADFCVTIVFNFEWPEQYVIIIPRENRT